jgi:hypothetical protein
MRTLLSVLVLFFLVAARANAQTTTPYTTADRILWDASQDVASVADAQAAVYKGYASGSSVPVAAVTLAHTCVAPVAPDVKASCSATIPATLLPALNARTSVLALTAGATITGTDGQPTLVESPQSPPFVAGRPYGAPGRPRLSR